MSRGKDSDSGRAGAPSLLDRNIQWVQDIDAGLVTVREIADREFLSPGAVRKAVKLAREHLAREGGRGKR